MSQSAIAQKYGHLNSGNFLQELAEVKSANSQLKSYQDQLVKKGEEMAGAFQTKLEAYMTKAQSGEISQVQAQQEEGALQKEREAIMAYEQEVMAKVQQKRKELIEPILKRVDDAIKAVGKENGYQFIFDTSLTNAILFVKESDDVTPLVKTKLGI
jgi:outer membrane protein